jgi:hypothetical protein
MVKGSALKGALAAAPKGGRVTSLPVKAPPQGVMAGIAQGIGGGLQRMSPGVYRNPQGQLVNSKGGALPGQRQPQRPSMNPQYNNVASLIGGSARQQPFQPNMPLQQPGFRQPAPYQPGQDGMMYMGGSPNFNETTGQYNPELSAITQASQAAQQQMGQPSYNPQMQFAGGFGNQMPQQQYNQQQGFQQGIVANREPIAPQGQLSPAELQARQNGTFKGYNY